MKSSFGQFAAVAGAGVLAACACLAISSLSVALAIGTALLVFAVVIVLAFAKVRFRRFGTPIVVFFIAASLHALFGYFTAGYSTEMIWISGTTAPFYDTAFVIIALFLAAAAVGYALRIHFPMYRIRSWALSLDVNEDKLFRFGKILLAVGVVIGCGAFYDLGYLPLLSDAPGQARFVRTLAGTSFRTLVDEWVINRALDLLSCSVPLAFLCAVRKRRVWDWIWFAAGLLAVVMPARRANVLSIILFIASIRLLQHRKVLRYIPLVLAAGAILFVVQNSFVNANGEFSRWEVAGSALPELRDLGWTVSLIGNQFMNGMTFVQSFVPIPSFLSQFYQQYSLREITNVLTGLKESEESGGLRITLAGEAYLNFWFFGPVLVGLFFGVLCAYLEVITELFRASGSTIGLYIASMAIIWWCFWFYLAGTQASAAVRIGLFIVAGLIYLTKRPSRHWTTISRASSARIWNGYRAPNQVISGPSAN